MEMMEKFAKFVQKPLLSQFNVQITTDIDFWEHYSKHFSCHYGQYITFHYSELANQYQKNTMNQLASNAIHLLILDGDNIIGMHVGNLCDDSSYQMYLTVIHPDYRQQGVYSAFLDLILEASKTAGCQYIKSSHSLDNNPIIIAKLKKGFHLVSFDLLPCYGPAVWLHFYHNDKLKEAYHFRCNGWQITPDLYQLGNRTALLKKALTDTEPS